MILRLLNFVVIGALVLAAAYVYRIKFNSTVQAERLAKLRSEVRHERDTIAALRAQWSRLDDPARIQVLADRFLSLKPINPTQFDTLDNLPDRPTDDETAANKDPIGGLIENFEHFDAVTGSVPASAVPPQAPTPAGIGKQGAAAPDAPAAAAAANAAANPAPSGAARP
jgi:hypothetical protein